MPTDPNAYDPEDEEDDKASYQLPPSTPLANPVLKSFDTPAAAATDTTPAATPPQAPAQPDQQSSVPSGPPPAPQAAPPPTPVPIQPQAATPAPAPAASAAPAPQPQSDTPPNEADTDKFQSDGTALAQSNTERIQNYFAAQEAALKFHKSQGGATEILPTTSAEVISRDASGNPRYVPGVISAFTRGEDGNGYRVTRNADGSQTRFNLADGVNGTDYRTDPANGDRYVVTNGANGGSKREVIGNDPVVPALNTAQQAVQAAVQGKAQTDLTIDQATNGIQGQGPLRAASLSDLRGEVGQINTELKPLAQQLSDLSSYTPDNDASASQADLDQKRQLADQLGFKQQRLAQVQSEIDARDGTIADARQQRDSISQQGQLASARKTLLQNMQKVGGLPAVQGFLKDLATTGKLEDPNPTNDEKIPRASRLVALSSMGLVSTAPAGDGTNNTILRVTPLGVSMLDSDTQAAIKANPQQYTVSAGDVTGLPHVTAARQAVAGMADTSAPGASSTQPPYVVAPDGTVHYDTSDTAKSIQAAAKDGVVDPATAQQHLALAQSQKGYSVGADGKLAFDPERASLGVAQAIRDGVLDPASASQALDLAKTADQQRAELVKLAGGAPKLKALLAGVVPGLGFVGAGSAAAAVGNAGINETISAFTGPFAPATEAVLSGAEFIGGGLLGARATKALQQKASQYSDTLKSLNAAAQLHPNYEAAGELIPALPGAVSSVGNLTKLGGAAVDALGEGATTSAKVTAAAKAVGTKVGGGAAGGAATEAVLRPAVDYTLNKGADTLGIQHDDVQAPTLSSIAQMALLGALLSAHHDGGTAITPDEGRNIIQRGDAADAAGISLERALSKRELESYMAAKQAVMQQQAGQAAQTSPPSGQDTRSFSPGGVSSAQARPAPQESSTTLHSSDAPPAPVPSVQESSGSRADLPTSPGTRAQGDSSATPSPVATNPAAAGQDEPTITRANDQSTITHGATTITVPTSREAAALDIMRGGALAPAEPVPAAQGSTSGAAELPPARTGDGTVAATTEPPAASTPRDEATDSPRPENSTPATTTPRPVAAAIPGESPKQTLTRQWIAAERTAGRDPSVSETAAANNVHPVIAEQLLDAQDRTEEEARTRAATTPAMENAQRAADNREQWVKPEDAPTFPQAKPLGSGMYEGAAESGKPGAAPDTAPTAVPRSESPRTEAARASSPGSESERASSERPRDRDLEAEDRARHEYEAELRAQGREAEEATGPELLKAVADFGGVNPDDSVLKGELQNLRDASKPAALAGVPGVFNIFRRNAGSLDQLTSHLRSLGFPVETPADTLDLLHHRLTQRKPIHGSYAREDAQSGMERAGAYYRRQEQGAPTTPDDLKAQANKWRGFLQKVVPKTALRLEVIRKMQLDSLYGSKGRVPSDVQAAYLNRTLYLVHEALAANPDHLSVVNLLHEAAHAFERTLPDEQRNRLREQWKAEIGRGRSPLHNTDGTRRANVDPRALDTSKPENFSEWFAERLAWENHEWAQGRATEANPFRRFVERFRTLLQRTFEVLRPVGRTLTPEENGARFRDWLTRGAPEENAAGPDGQQAQSAIRDWFRGKRGIGVDQDGQPARKPVGSGREEVAPQAGLDPITGTPLDPDFERAVAAGTSATASGPTRGDSSASGLGGSADADAPAGTRSSGGSPGTDLLIQKARDTGRALKEFVARTGGQRDSGSQPLQAHRTASDRLTRQANDPTLTPEQQADLRGIRSTVPLIREGDFLRHVDAAHLLDWIKDRKSQGYGMEGREAVSHAQTTAASEGTLSKLFPGVRGEQSTLEERLARTAKDQAANGVQPRLRVLGVGGEGAVFSDRGGRGAYKIHPGGPESSAQGITDIQPGQQEGATNVASGPVPATEAALRYLRQSSLPVSSPTEIKGITENGRLITRQPLLDAERPTTREDIDRMMASAGGKRIQVEGRGTELKNSFAVPDGQGNWHMAVDLKPENVLRDRATGEPKLTDGILSPITPEVLKNNPQLAEHPATNPEAQFARRGGSPENDDDTALPKQGPISVQQASDAARRQIDANESMLRGLGVQDVRYGDTRAGSGVEFRGDGRLTIDPAKLARSLAAVRDKQQSKGIDGTPEDWFRQVLAHEGIHAADAAVAHAKGQTVEERYNELPSAAMPKGWQETGRKVYGAKNWDALETWQQKGEFVRQVVEGKYTGRVTEQLYKFVQEAIEHLKSVAGFQDADPQFKAHIAEIEARMEAARPERIATTGANDSPNAAGTREWLADRWREDKRPTVDQVIRRQEVVNRPIRPEEASVILSDQVRAQDMHTLAAGRPDDYRPATDDERRALKIPPAWTDVHVARDSNARRVAVGRDSQGRVQSRYSTAHTSEQQAAKFERVKDFEAALPGIMGRVNDSLATGKGQEEAAALRLIHRTGFRNGGDADTGAKVKAFGASNLRAEHVKFDGDTTHFDFPGKSGVRQQHSVTDPELTADLRQRAAKGGALFDTTDAKVRDYLKASGDFKVHDFRTRAASSLARQEVADSPVPRDAETFWNERDRIGDLAAKKLGDTRKIALESYVDPTVFEPWKNTLGITDETRPATRKTKSAAAATTAREGGTVDAGNRPADEGARGNQQLRGRSAPGAGADEVRAAGGVADDAPQAARRTPVEAAEGDEKIPTTYEGVRGEKLNRQRTAFAPDSGTLGIPRDQMPQVAAEHRGALANFLKARGIGWQNDDVLPGSLKPSQADFNPGKVEKARAWVGDSDRRILTSSDDRVVDGHHQWLARLQDHPSEPMPVVRLNAPARDILGQAHEFPSAGMEKAADISSRTEPTPFHEAEPIIQQTAREKIAALRQSGEPIPPQMNILANHDLSKLNAVGQERYQQIAAAMDSAHGLELSDRGVVLPGTEGDTNRNTDGPQAATRPTFAERSAQGKREDSISGRFDAVDNMASRSGRQAKQNVRLDIQDDQDRQAAGVLAQARFDRGKLAGDLAKAQAGPDPKLAAKYAPVYQRALDNFDRLHGASEGYRHTVADQDAHAQRAGLEPRELFPDGRTAADQIAAGQDPKSTDLGDMAERHTYETQRAVNEHVFQNGLAELKASDGKPLLSSIKESTTTTNADGSVSSTVKVPEGYKAVQAGGNVLVAHKEIAPLLESLYGSDDWKDNFLGKHLLNFVAFAKHGTVGIFDTYHGARQAMKGFLGFGTAGWDKGLAALDYTDADLPRAVKAGEISQVEADYAKKVRPVVNLVQQEGLNTGKVSDNLLEAAQQHSFIERIPLVGHALTRVNNYVFHKIQRGVMTQAAVVAFERNRARFPEMSEREVARQSAKEVNEFFGNLGHQGFLKSPNMQNAARVVFLAPQFAESMMRSEARGYAQAAKVPADLASGKGFRVGGMAQAMGSTVMAMLIGNQMLNMFTRGHPTWDNEEEGHKWDAFIPDVSGKGHGFFFSPLSVAAEYTHALMKYTEGGQSLPDAVAHTVSNKFSGVARGAKDLLSGTDYADRPFASTGERVKAAAVDALPLPMPAGPFIQKNPKSSTGYGWNHEPGAVQRQLMAAIGLKVENAPSARSQMYQMAQPFRTNGGGGGGGAHPASPYGDLRHMLDNNDLDGAGDEVRRLTTVGGKTVKDVRHAMSISDDGNVRPEYFTGNPKDDKRMLATLTVPQRRVYQQAQREHADIAHRFQAIAARASRPLVAR